MSKSLKGEHIVMKSLLIRSLVFFLGGAAILVQSSEVRGQQAAAPASAFTPTVMSRDYTRTHSFPNIFDSFAPLSVPQPGMQNSPRLKDLIRDGKLWLSLQDAIALALENNLDIDYARFNIPFAQADYLRTRAGSAARGVRARRSRRRCLQGPLARLRAAGEVDRVVAQAAQAIPAVAPLIWVPSAAAIPLFPSPRVGTRATTPLETTVLTGLASVNSTYNSFSAFYGQGFMTGTSIVAGCLEIARRPAP